MVTSPNRGFRTSHRCGVGTSHILRPVIAVVWLPVTTLEAVGIRVVSSHRSRAMTAQEAAARGNN